jgi:hypothetical protein
MAAKTTKAKTFFVFKKNHSLIFGNPEFQGISWAIPNDSG